MTRSSDSGRPLPGWGCGVRRWQFQAGRTALTLAALAGLSLAGCSPSPVQPTGSSTMSVNSAPAQLRGALTLARLHLNGLPLAASNPFHLVRISGRHLDATGATVPTGESLWEFVFSRYAESVATQKYETVTVLVPGTGATQVLRGESADPALSPIEHWDDAIDATSPDSEELLAPFKRQGLPTAGAEIAYAQGKVTVTAGGKQLTYDTAERTFSAIR